MHERLQELTVTAAPAVAGASALDLGDAWERLLEMAARQDAELVRKELCRRPCGPLAFARVVVHLCHPASAAHWLSTWCRMCACMCLSYVQDAGRGAQLASHE